MSAGTFPIFKTSVYWGCVWSIMFTFLGGVGACPRHIRVLFLIPFSPLSPPMILLPFENHLSPYFPLAIIYFLFRFYSEFAM